MHALDPLSISMLFPAVVMLLLALEWGGVRYSWGSWRIILLFVLSSTAFLVFVGLQALRPSAAILPARVLKQRSVLLACVAGTSIVSAMTTILYFLPLYFQGIKRATPVQSGTMILATIVTDLVFAIITGTLSKYHYYFHSPTFVHNLYHY